MALPPIAPARTALMIVPTYNEAGNIEALLDALLGLPLGARTGWQLHVLVRDDSSPDGTGDIVDALASGRHEGRLAHSRGVKQGLGRALELAFGEAMELGYEVVMTMDADFSHDPRDVVELLHAINGGADVAVGSRTTPGGLIPGDWPLDQIVRTRVAAAVARGLGGVDPRLRELTTNFRAMRREVLAGIDFGRIRARGYGFQLFLANAFSSSHWTVEEVPISFRSRAAGASKASARDVIEFVRIAAQLNDDSPAKQFARFLLVALSGALLALLVVGLGRLLMPADALAAPWWIAAAALQAAILWSALWHPRFSFRRYRIAVRDGGRARPLVDLLRFEGLNLLTWSAVAGAIVTTVALGALAVVVQVLAVAAGVLITYRFSSARIWDPARAAASATPALLAATPVYRRAA
jgi:dolichol-phosphate mannosyltransferase